MEKIIEFYGVYLDLSKIVAIRKSAEYGVINVYFNLSSQGAVNIDWSEYIRWAGANGLWALDKVVPYENQVIVEELVVLWRMYSEGVKESSSVGI